MRSPYQELGPEAFWRSAIADPAEPADLALYRPKWPISQDTPVFTAGSCFAQHVTQALRAADCNLIDTEPMRGDLPEALCRRYGYGLYSARFGNIYTFRQFRQLIDEVLGNFEPASWIWRRDDGYYDALRPGVEPSGFGTESSLREARARHLEAVLEALRTCEVIVFTIGMTEAWEHVETGTIFSTAPGTVAGDFDPAAFQFRNLTYEECIADFAALRASLARIKPDIKMLLTVSPVPLTATASGKHVLSASTQSKAILRAVCGAMAEAHEDVDHFPAFEIVNAPRRTGSAFQENLRTPSEATVARVMNVFFAAHGITAEGTKIKAGIIEDPNCEDALLEAFAT